MHLLVLLFTLLGQFSLPVVYNEEPITLYTTGDNLAFAAKNLNDKTWSEIRGNTANRVFWSRTHLKLHQTDSSQRPLGLLINSFGAFEVYWDGVLIGKNGKIAINGKEEEPGTESSVFLIPDSLSIAGDHLIALRTTQTAQPSADRRVGFRIFKYSTLLTMPLIAMAYMNLMAGAFLTAAVYYFFLYINSKRRQLTILIFATICLLFFLLLIMEYLKFHVVIPYHYFYTRLEVIGWLTFAIALLVPWYFAIHFHLEKRMWLFGILLLILLVIYVYNHGRYDLTASLYSLAMLMSTFLIVGKAIVRKEKGGFIVFAGLVISGLVGRYIVYDYGLFISFTVIVLCMLYLHSIRASELEQEHQEALALSSRLQLELLKKNIQPHYLRNTLTSMMDWVEESPKDGARFIQELAAEFGVMNDIAEQTLIPITQEIELCKRHLAVMEFRKEINFQWEDSGIDESEMIPPAILHTILENGITHSIPLSGNGITFRLTYIKRPTMRQYLFETLARNRPISENRHGGTGFKYIQARLLESYGQKWTFHSAATATGWLTTINILN
ncbi:histidine kinase [Pedobacter insulae]|uniref:Histidine kinase n=1 Tax=Pedobacter insulae TaxID=414048 RepID=A0A1I2WRJ2_9SPHI|nr:sensor histidine kinase [Pedobacter insulae]SFH04010.1 Histidine kinase [Pedobacter insulae]